jgi:hypothetical protein
MAEAMHTTETTAEGEEMEEGGGVAGQREEEMATGGLALAGVASGRQGDNGRHNRSGWRKSLVGL